MTEEITRIKCTCDKCEKEWVTRSASKPSNCPRCGAREHIWNKSEHLVDVAEGVDKLSMEK